MARSTPKAATPSRIATLACEWCGEDFIPKRVDQRRCTVACHRAMSNFERERTRKLYRILYAMVDQDKPQLMKLVKEEVRRWIEEDEAEGRPPPGL